MAKPRSLIQKGRNFQTKVCKLFADVFRLGEDDIRTAIGVETGCDIKFSTKARDKVHLSIECKNVRSLNLWEALKQAKANTLDNTVPAVVVHRSIPGNKDVWIVVPLSHYLEIRRDLDQQHRLE